MRTSRIVGLAALAVGGGALVYLGVSSALAEQRYAANAMVLESPEHGPELCVGGVLTSLPPQCGGPPITNWDWDAVAGEESRGGTTWTDVYVEGTYDGERFTLTADPSAPRRRDEPETDFSDACDDPEVVDERDGADDWEAATQGERGAPWGEIPGLAAVWLGSAGQGGRSGPFVANVVVLPGYRDEAIAHIRRTYDGYLCVVENDQRTAKELETVMERINDVLGDDLLSAGSNYRRGVVEAEVIVVTDEIQQRVDEAFGEGTVALTGALKPI